MKLVHVLFAISSRNCARNMLVSPQIPAKWRNLVLGRNEILWNKAVTSKEEIFPIFPSCSTLGFPGGRLCVWDVFQGVSSESIPMKVKGRHRIDQGRNAAVRWASSPSQFLTLALELKYLISFPVLYSNSHDYISVSISRCLWIMHKRVWPWQGGCLQLRGSWIGSRLKGKSGWCIFTSTTHSVFLILSFRLFTLSLKNFAVCFLCARHSLKFWEFSNEQTRALNLKGPTF